MGLLDQIRLLFSKKTTIDEMKYLIVGLGNIGDQYDHTRHNIGFEVLDKLSEQHEVPWKLSRHALQAELSYRGKKLVLIKPTTYMNLSGKAVQYWMSKEKIPPSRTLIILDDIHIDFNRIKIKPKGNHGGHNGLKNIDAVLGHSEYPRLRVGIGNDFRSGQQVNYVLGKWSTKEMEQLDPITDHCAEVVYSFVQQGIHPTMSAYNRKKIDTD